MNYHKRLLKSIEEGKEGKNVGIPFALPELNWAIGGLRRKKYILCGAASFTGKTALVDYILVSAIKWLVDNPESKKTLKCFYDTLEIDIDSKLAKWSCLLLYLTEGIIVDSDVILSSKRKRDSDEIAIIPKGIEDKIVLLEPYFKIIEQYVTFFDNKINPTGIWKRLKGYCEENGKWIKSKKIIEIDGKPIEENVNIYQPNNSEEVVLSIIDHISLQKGEKDGHSGVFLSGKKQIIDKTSEYMIELRNTYGISCIDISQFNRDSNDIQRKKFEELTPQSSDFKESGVPYEDCDICIAPFSPNNYNLPKYREYNLSSAEVSNRFMYIYILKNRSGKGLVGIPMKFLGECGYFEELPYTPELSTYNKIIDFSKKVTE